MAVGFMLVVGVSLASSPPCGACPPSGGPSEVLWLTLESVRVDGQAREGSEYGVDRLSIEGVGSTFTLHVEAGDTTLRVEFSK